MSTDVANLTADRLATIQSVITASYCRAEYWGEVTAVFLRESNRLARIRGPIRWPQSYLLDVSAALELRSWQFSGSIPERLQGYPAWNQVLGQALDRLSNPDPYPLPTSLQRDLARVWFEESVWHAHRLLGAPIRSGELDVALLFDAFARLLWDNRHLAKTEG